MNLRLLPFPLNVYAQTLAFEYGADYQRAAHLHFGVFDAAQSNNGDHPASDYISAQQSAQELLLAYLLAIPASVLEWGFGDGSLARALGNLGYRIDALSNDAEEYRHVRSVVGDGASANLHFHCTDFAQFHPDERVDILVLQQSAQYLDPLLLLTRAADLLRPGGQLLIVDEFLLDDTRREPQPRPLLTHFLQLSERCGLTVERQLELGDRVAPGLAIFHELLRKHRDTLAAALQIDLASIDNLTADLAKQHENFLAGRFGYTLLDLRRGPLHEHDVVYGSIGSFQIDEVRPIFESSFDARFDPAVWQWKYGGGRGRAVCARIDRLLIGHYGGAPRDIRYFGKPDKAIQICDVMVMPEYRSFANRDTLFFKTAATFLEQQIGNAANHLLGFGFPNMRVLQMAKRLGLYDTTDTFIELHYSPQSEPADAAFEVVPFALSEPESRLTVDALWEQMAGDLREQIVGVRDWTYLYYRYCTHPLWAVGGYVCVALHHRGMGEIAALAILKPHEGGRLLMDIIGATDGFPEQLRALNAWLTEGGESLCCRITEGQAQHLTLPGCERRDLGIEIPCNSWTRGPLADELKGAWWLTAGDMDFL